MKKILPVLLLLALFACKNSKSTGIGQSKMVEPHRPVFHFTPPENWMNDPNGMVYFEGEYHLFYQYFPDSTVWGPMHWGHAVSRDLKKWEHLPIALYPDSLGLIFSGSVVVDWKNTSGFGLESSDQPPLVAIFTQHLMAGEKAGRSDFQYQSIAFSNDKGRTWTKYAGNPVIPNPTGIRDFRDPKVIWHEPSKKWILVLAAGNHVKFYSSPDLKNWQHLSDFGQNWGEHGGVWECPDFFPLQNGWEEQPRYPDTKWILLQSLNPGSPNGGSGTQYFVGDFDGKTFSLDPDFEKSLKKEKAIWLDYGRDNYAGVTFSDAPPGITSRIFMGWMSNWDYAQVVPTEKWRSAMTLPRRLTLRKTPDGWRLFSHPSYQLRGKKHYHLENQKVTGDLDLTKRLKFSPRTSEILVEIELPENEKPTVGFEIFNSKNEKYRVGFDASKNEFFSDRTKSGKSDFSEKFAAKKHTAPRQQNGRILKLHLFLDRASCELFADDGSTAMTDIFFPNEDFSNLKIFTENGSVQVKNIDIFQIK